MKNTIRVERAKLNISQTELAVQVGVTKQTIHSVETGRFVPSTVLAMKIASFFKVRIEDIFELEDSDWK